jgi:hypothetical protein
MGIDSEDGFRIALVHDVIIISRRVYHIVYGKPR